MRLCVCGYVGMPLCVSVYECVTCVYGYISVPLCGCVVYDVVYTVHCTVYIVHCALYDV